MDTEDRRYNIVGCEDVPHFGPAVANGNKVKVDDAMPWIVRKAVHALFCWNAPSFLHIRIPFDFTRVYQSMILSQHVISSLVDTRTTRSLAFKVAKIHKMESKKSTIMEINPCGVFNRSHRVFHVG